MSVLFSLISLTTLMTDFKASSLPYLVFPVSSLFLAYAFFLLQAFFFLQISADLLKDVKVFVAVVDW